MAALDPGVLLPRLPLQDENGNPFRAPEGETLYAAFKTTCPTCALAWPYLERVREVSEGGMRVVAISQDPAPAAREFQSRHGARIETAYDPEPWRASDALGLTTVPTFFRVAADGRIAERIEGWNRERMRELAERGAGLAGRRAADIVQPGEDPPATKPG